MIKPMDWRHFFARDWVTVVEAVKRLQPVGSLSFTYVDWTLEEQPRPFYVGKGTRGRVVDRDRNGLHTWIGRRLGMRREVVLASPIEADAFRREVELQ